MSRNSILSFKTRFVFVRALGGKSIRNINSTLNLRCLQKHKSVLLEFSLWTLLSNFVEKVSKKKSAEAGKSTVVSALRQSQEFDLSHERCNQCQNQTFSLQMCTKSYLARCLKFHQLFAKDCECLWRVIVASTNLLTRPKSY